jgi:uncharacterized membrane protein YidH (DUF202 family)
MSKVNSTLGKNTFWDYVRDLRRRGVIPLHWTRNDLRPHLQNRYTRNYINTVPSNQSMKKDGSEIGNYVKRGSQPEAWRISRGKFELIDDPVPHTELRDGARFSFISGFLRIGLALLVFAVNFMVIDYTLKITSPNTPGVIDKLMQIGLFVVVVGVVVVGIGFINVVRRRMPSEAGNLFTAGSDVFAIGASTMIRAFGHDFEPIVKNGALVAAIIGFVFIIVYAIHSCYPQLFHSRNRLR